MSDKAYDSKTLLVVEDNLDNQKLMTWILEDEGYDSVCVTTGEEGVSIVKEHQFDLVLMDISLPGIDGKEATRRIRQHPKGRGLPIIAVTAHAIPSEQDSIMASGVDGLITKPIDENELISTLVNYLN